MTARVIDLSYHLEPTTPVYPGDPGVEIQILESTRFTRPDGQRALNNSRISTGNHCGTHMDAPFHFFEDGRTIDRVDLDRCAGPALLIRLRDIAENGEIHVPHLNRYRARLQELGKVVFETGWSERWGKPEYFIHHPVISPAAAEFLIASRVHLVGIDVPSVDRPPFPVHAALLRHDIVILENLTNLSALSSEVFELVAVPLKITGRDGSPVRAMAREVS
jgi:kynurenine formamidase